MIEKSRIAFLVGMPRAATTFLYHNLNLHPELFVPYRRKTNYFSLHQGKGEDWFLSHFKEAPATAVAVDTETLAFINSGLVSPQLIKAFNQDARIILCVRDPAAWVVSLHRQISTFDKNVPDFATFLAGHYTLVEDGVATEFRMGPGAVAARVREYQELFPASLLILRFRDVIDSPVESLGKIETFLQISRFYHAGNVITKDINSSKRRHSRLLNRLLRNEHAIASTRALVPRRAVLAMRWVFDVLLAGDRHAHKVKVDDGAEAKKLSLARAHYDSDRQALAKYI